MSTDKTWLGHLVEPDFRLATANATLVLVLLAAAAVRVGPVVTEGLVAIVVALAGIAVSARLGSLIGLVGWAFYTGFVENRYGVLTFSGDDLVRMVVMVAIGALLATATGRFRPAPKKIWSLT